MGVHIDEQWKNYLQIFPQIILLLLLISNYLKLSILASNYRRELHYPIPSNIYYLTNLYLHYTNNRHYQYKYQSISSHLHFIQKFFFRDKAPSSNSQARKIPLRIYCIRLPKLALLVLYYTNT